MAEQRASRGSDISAVAHQVVPTLAERRGLDDPEAAAAWLGDVGMVVRGEDASAKRRLACQLISLTLPQLDGEETHGYVDLAARVCIAAITEMNAIVARREGALVSFEEEPVSPEDLASAAQTMHAVMSEGGQRPTAEAMGR